MATQPLAPEPLDSEALLAGERHVLELLATNHDLSSVLDELCRLIDAHSGFMSSIYILDRDTRHMSLAAGPNVPEAWRAATKTFAVTTPAGTCTAAVAERRAVLVEDVASSDLYSAEWRAIARDSGIGSAWSTPFFASDGPVLGTFALFGRDRIGPSAALQQLVDRAVALASVAVERYQAVEGLIESERRFSAAFYSSPAMMSITRADDGTFLYVNDRFVELFEHSRAETIGRTALELGLWAEPSERDDVQQILKRLGAVASFEAKARTKSGAIRDLLVWMTRIQILGEDSVLGISCDITDRKQTERSLADSERLLRVVLDTLPVGVAVVNPDGDMTLTNAASRQIWGGQLREGRDRYAKSKGWWHATGQPVAPDDWASARALKKGESSLNEVIDIEAFDGVKRTIQNSSVPIRDRDGRITGAIIVNEDITARHSAEQKLQDSLTRLRALTGDLMRAQDEERRRIAQVLHETTAQDLAVLKMHLRRLERTDVAVSDDDRAALTESVELAERSINGIRTLSYLLFPPFLDDGGLLPAVRWYADGFSSRSGIRVTLDLPPTLDRFSRETETALFRVVQESLINIHRHAESDTAIIRLRSAGGRLTLEIEDHGRGVPPDDLANLAAGIGGGVGLSSMRERLQQLGGTFSITSANPGTVVHAAVPVGAGSP